ncbi:MFS transporter [Kocuria flava]|uniref:MFS transporter n=1 Tax=Kocuria flava TaxID=446860 RepID=UPI002F91F01B
MLSSASRTEDVGVRLGAGFLGVVLIAVNLRVGFVTVGPLLGEISGDLGLTAGQAGLLTGLPLAMFALFSPVAPALAARAGLDRALWLSLLLLTAGILGRSAPAEAAVWLGTAAIGVGIAFLNVLLPSLVKREFPQRVSQVTGLYSAIQSAAAAAGSALVVPVAAASPAGWRLALGVWAGVGLIALAVLAPWLRRAPEAPVRRPARAVPARSPWGSALGWQVTGFMGLQSVAFYVFMAWLPSIERSHEVPAAAAGAHMGLFLMSGVLASLATGALMERFADQRPVAVGAAVLAAVAYTGLALAPGLMLLWVLVGAVSCGALIVIALSLFSLRSSDPAQAAALSGMAQSVGYALAALAPGAVGALYDLTGSWRGPLLLVAAAMAGLCVTAWFAGRDRVLDGRR